MAIDRCHSSPTVSCLLFFPPGLCSININKLIPAVQDSVVSKVVSCTPPSRSVRWV